MVLLDIDTQTIYQIQSITIAFWEWILVFVLLILFTLLSHRKKMIYISREPEYKYYVWGFYAKFFSTLFFVIVFYYIYKGGDTYAYFSSAMSMANLFYKNPEHYFYALFHSNTVEAMSNFDFFTGYPYGYLVEDSRTYLVIKLVSFFAIITYKSFLISSVLLGYMTYRGSWKLFQLYYRYYPKLSFQMAISILFIPSALFYGSGILKDSFTFMSTCLFTVYFHDVFISKNYKYSTLFFLLIHVLIIFGIKPYILMILLPGLLIWTGFKRFEKIKNQAIKALIVPIMMLSVLGFTLIFFSSLGASMDKFSVDNALATAATTQNDLKSDYYEGASFDIGNFDGTPQSALLLFPAATIAGMFRPFITEASSPLILLSALENLFLLYLFMRLFLRGSPKRIYQIIANNPILIFGVLFSLFFAFMLGITTSNYGALTRFKIPMLPFFASTLFIIYYTLRLPIEKINRT
jgi:hypothetical protein